MPKLTGTSDLCFLKFSLSRFSMREIGLQTKYGI